MPTEINPTKKIVITEIETGRTITVCGKLNVRFEDDGMNNEFTRKSSFYSEMIVPYSSNKEGTFFEMVVVFRAD